MAQNRTPSLRSILEKEKLNRTNYADWIRNLRIVLGTEKKEKVLDIPLPDKHAGDATISMEQTCKKACDANLEVSCLNELCSTLNAAKSGGDNHMMAVQNKPTLKKRGKSWRKKDKAKSTISKQNPAPKARPIADNECFHCKELGHWKRDCKLYLALFENKGNDPRFGDVAEQVFEEFDQQELVEDGKQFEELP
ncbi:unnamed protein product [Urochloa humidicola]